MNKVLQALKRIRQETCPATVCSDFDKEECCNTIEKGIKALYFFLENTIIGFGFDEEESAYYVEINGGKIICTKEEHDLIKEMML